MSDEIVIPRSHWAEGEWGRDMDGYIPAWERHLRKSICDQPDPATRFGDWLSRLAHGEPGMGGVRMIFIEQPYLSWAQSVERIIELTEKELRKTIAFDITDPED